MSERLNDDKPVQAPMLTEPVELSRRELTLIRVAMIQRLDRLKGENGYNETRDLLNGKLWEVSLKLREREA